jgi:hypothetical protein
MAILNLIETIQTKLSTLAKKDGQLIVIRDNASLYVDLDGARIYISDWIDISTDEERLAMLSPLNNKYYYVVETNKIWRYISGSWVLVTQNNYEDLINKPKIEGVELSGNKTLADFGGKKQIKISWADYQALSTEEQNDESIVYYIHDYPSNIINAADISYDNATSGLTADEVQGAIDELENNKVTIGTTANLKSIVLDGSNYAFITNQGDDDITFRYKGEDGGNAWVKLSALMNSLNAKLPLAGGTLTGVLNTKSVNTDTIAPNEANTCYVGTTNRPYKTVLSNGFNVFKNGATYGFATVTTEGTTDTLGQCELQLGNMTEQGNNGNAMGRLVIFNKNSKYGVIIANDNMTYNNAFTLPSKSGTIPSVSLSDTTLTINL